MLQWWIIAYKPTALVKISRLAAMRAVCLLRYNIQKGILYTCALNALSLTEMWWHAL
jgi:hypothetical protein